MCCTIYAFAGKKRSGKTFAARQLATTLAGERPLFCSFAETLRIECLEFTTEDVFTDERKDKKVDVCTFNSDGLLMLDLFGPSIVTNRDFMKAIARDAKEIDPNCYARSVVRKIGFVKPKIVIIDDLRFPSEYRMLAETGHKVIVMFIGDVHNEGGCHASEDVETLVREIMSMDGAQIVFHQGN